MEIVELADQIEAAGLGLAELGPIPCSGGDFDG